MDDNWQHIRRKRIHDSLQEHHQLDPDGGLITGWVLLYEVRLPDNESKLMLESSDTMGEQSLPQWTERGWLHWAAMQDDWLTPDDDTENDDQQEA